MPKQLRELAAKGVNVRPLFLDATTDTLVRRFSETRRRHPLSGDSGLAALDQQHALVDAIELERELLSDLREKAHVIDTSQIRNAQLQGYVKSLLSAPSYVTRARERCGVPLDVAAYVLVSCATDADRARAEVRRPLAFYLGVHGQQIPIQVPRSEIV